MKSFIITFGLIGIEEQSHDLLHCLMYSIITATMTAVYRTTHVSPCLLCKQIESFFLFLFQALCLFHLLTIPVLLMEKTLMSMPDTNSNVVVLICDGPSLIIGLAGILWLFSENHLNNERKYHHTAPLVRFFNLL